MERISLYKNIVKLNPNLIFYKNSARPVWFDLKYKYSVIFSKRKIKTKNLNVYEIKPYIYITPIILDISKKEFIGNVVKIDNRYIIIDEEIFLSENIYKRCDDPDPISTIISEICYKFKFERNNVKIIKADDDYFIFKYNNKFIFLDANNSDNDYTLHDLNLLKQLYKEEKISLSTYRRAFSRDE